MLYTASGFQISNNLISGSYLSIDLTSGIIKALVAGKYARAIRVYVTDIYGAATEKQYIFDVVTKTANSVIVQNSDFVTAYGQRANHNGIVIALG